MIKAYISIGLNNGQKVVYVRDEVTDTMGVGGQYYGYAGPAHTDLKVKSRKVSPTYDLKEGGSYTFKLNNEEYEISIPTAREPAFHTFGASYKGAAGHDILGLLNRATHEEGYVWSELFNGNIRCRSTNIEKSEEVVIEEASSGEYLFDAMGVEVLDGVGEDALLDQEGEDGLILEDYNSIVSFIESQKDLPLGDEEESIFLEFPESTPTKNLIRKNNSDNAFIHSSIMTTIPIKAISEITIVEKWVEDHDSRVL